MTRPSISSVCLVDFWGLGDAVMMTPMLQALRAEGIPTTVACKPGTCVLLQPSYPEVTFVTFDPPWTAFRGKYRLWRWPWLQLARLVWQLRRPRFAVAISVRRDPRDHLLMWLMGAHQRLSFRSHFSDLLLTRVFERESRPVVEDWMALERALFPDHEPRPPALNALAYGPAPTEPVTSDGDFTLGLHVGARISVRRWSNAQFRVLIHRLREVYRFRFVLFLDLDGHGRELSDLADEVLSDLPLPALVQRLAACNLLLCNDSAPGHIADAIGVPVVAIFGPTHPVWFRPYSAHNLVVIRDICPFRPCFDYCRFDEPKCLTELTAAGVFPEIHAHLERLIETGLLPATFRRDTPPP